MEYLHIVELACRTDLAYVDVIKIMQLKRVEEWNKRNPRAAQAIAVAGWIVIVTIPTIIATHLVYENVYNRVYWEVYKHTYETEFSKREVTVNEDTVRDKAFQKELSSLKERAQTINDGWKIESMEGFTFPEQKNYKLTFNPELYTEEPVYYYTWDGSCFRWIRTDEGSIAVPFNVETHRIAAFERNIPHLETLAHLEAEQAVTEELIKDALVNSEAAEIAREMAAEEAARIAESKSPKCAMLCAAGGITAAGVGSAVIVSKLNKRLKKED